nr:MAG TPA: hypothetical protein [Caudoviricetes sp.]
MKNLLSNNFKVERDLSTDRSLLLFSHVIKCVEYKRKEVFV